MKNKLLTKLIPYASILVLGLSTTACASSQSSVAVASEAAATTDTTTDNTQTENTDSEVPEKPEGGDNND